MKHDEKILSDYYGALYYIKKNKDKKLTIFIVDDDLFYLHLLEEEISRNTKFEIFTFTTGEKCLNALELSPDLVILDFHLDDKLSYPKNGDIIAKEIKKRLPETETIIISSDHSIALVNELNHPSIHLKDGHIKEKVQSIFLKILKKRKVKWLENTIFPLLMINFLLICFVIYLNLFIYIKL